MRCRPVMGMVNVGEDIYYRHHGVLLMEQMHEQGMRSSMSSLNRQKDAADSAAE